MGADKNVQIKAAEAAADAKCLQGTGIARQRGAIVDGLRESLELSPDRVSELLLITQYFDTVKEISQGKATTVFVPGGKSGNDISTQMRDGLMQARSANMPGQQRM